MYNQEFKPTETVGAFYQSQQSDMLQTMEALTESFSQASLDPVGDIRKIAASPHLSEQYKDVLFSDLTTESAGVGSGFDSPLHTDDYMSLLPSKLNQLADNTLSDVLESTVGVEMSPIVGFSLPILKKSFLRCNAKDVMLTEVPKEPIIRVAFERKFLKNHEGEKFYIPDIFYAKEDSMGEYDKVMAQSRGEAITDQEYNLPLPDGRADVLTDSGGSVAQRDRLAANFAVIKVVFEIASKEYPLENLQIQPEHSSQGMINSELSVVADDGNTYTDMIVGKLDTERGVVSLACTAGLIKKVKFGGNLSNVNNLRGLELDRERIGKTWMIDEGNRFNTGFTEERIRDTKALIDMSVTAETISEMAETMNQAEDSDMFRFLEQSLIKWTEPDMLPYGYDRGFVEHATFSMLPATNVYLPVSQWSHDIKWYLNRQFDELKEKLNTPDIMFVVFANPGIVSLFSDSINWVTSKNSRVGGIELDYQYGVMTGTGTRVHVVSSLKVPRNVGVRTVAYPTNENHITFKHYKYSTFVTNQYRNPITPSILNIMGTSRYLTSELLPVQGRMEITNADFGRTTNTIKRADLPGFK